MLEITFYVGIDCGNEKHSVCIDDAQGRARKEAITKNDLSLLETLRAVVGDVPPASVHVAVEDSRSPLVDTLLARGFIVHTINPKQVDRFRDRENVAGAKDDRRDARVLARALRTDRDFFHVVEPRTEHGILLQGAVDIIETLEEDHGRKSNQLRALLLRFLPGLLVLCEGANEAWFWELLLLLKSVENAKGVTDEAIHEVLKNHRIRAVTAAKVRNVINGKHLATAAGVVEACFRSATMLIECLQLLERQIKEAEKCRGKLLDDERTEDGKASTADLLRSIPGIADKTAAIIIVDGARALHADRLGLLRALAGVAPVTKRSGKKKSGEVVMRYACNNRLRHVLHHAAGTCARYDERFAEQYRRHREKGHSHGRACRSVADSMLTVLAAMLKNRTLFERRPLAAEA